MLIPKKMTYGINANRLVAWRFDPSKVFLGGLILTTQQTWKGIDDTQAYIRMDCERGNPVSALGVGGNGFWREQKL